MKTILFFLLLLCQGLPAQTPPTGQPLALSNAPGLPAGEVLFPPRYINYNGADLGILLRKYSELVDRNVLRSPTVETALKAPVYFINQTALTRTGAIQAFQAIFATNGVALIEDGNKFLKVVRVKDAASHRQNSVHFTPEATPVDRAGSADAILFPPKHINYNGAELGMVLQKYSELIGRKPLRSPRVESALKAPVFFVNQTPLARSEAIHAYEMILALNGVALVEVDEKSMKVVTVAEALGTGQEKSTGSATGAGAEKSPSASGAANPSTPTKK